MRDLRVPVGCRCLAAWVTVMGSWVTGTWVMLITRG